jgi:hypothetical protein
VDKKMSKVKYSATFFGSVLVLIVFLVMFSSFIFIGGLGKGIFYSIIDDEEARLKAEYITIFSDTTDGSLSELLTKTGSGAVVFTDDGKSIDLRAGFTSSPATATFNKKFNGEVVTLLISGGIMGDPNSEGSCSVSPGGKFTGTNSKIVYEPHTFDNGYDVYQDGVKVSEFNNNNGFQVSVSCQQTGGRSTIAGNVLYLGYRLKQCSVLDDEVAIQVEFSDRVNIQDIENLGYPIPVGFCHEAKPFTLRSDKGEEVIRKQEGIILFNQGKTIPLDRELEPDETIIINYYAKNYDLPSLDCKIDESYKKVNGEWKCIKTILDATSETREVIDRQISYVESDNTFSFVSSDEQKYFYFGKEKFEVLSNKYLCEIEPQQILTPPNPASNCYTTDINFLSSKSTLADTNNKDLSNNINLQYYAIGQIRDNDNELEGKYIFSITNPFIIDGLVENNKVKFIIQNNLPTNNNFNVKIKQYIERTNQNLEERTEVVNLVKGLNEFEFDINNQNLGNNYIELQGFYKIESNSVVLIPTNKIKLGFVVNNDNTITQTSELISTTQSTSLLQKIIDFFKGILALFGG